MSEGWTGPTIPLDMQALVVAKHFNQALNLLLKQLALLHQELNEALEKEDTGSGVINALQQHPFFESVMLGLVEGEEKFGDTAFRWSADRLGREAHEEIRDALVYLPIMCWVASGATFPEGAFDETDDEEE